MCIRDRYKSGSDGTLPVPAHERQLKSYMDALAADADKPVRGALILSLIHI